MRQAKEKADRYKKIGDMKKEALDQVADNLKKQMSDSGQSSGVRLLPQGTDLYVRQYQSVPARRAQPDAHSAVARIYAQHAAENPGPDSATADSIQDDQIKTSRSVQAKMLKEPK